MRASHIDIPAPRYDHLRALTDAGGLYEHADRVYPRRERGYCVDDVARAVQVDLLHGRTLGWAAVEQSAWRG